MGLKRYLTQIRQKRTNSRSAALIAGVIVAVAGLLVSIAPHSALADVTAGLTRHWELNEGTGTTATDSTGSGFDGTLEGGAGWGTELPFGTVATFDGVDGRISLPDGAIEAAPRTVSVWFKSNDVSASQTLIEWGPITNCDPSRQGLTISTNSETNKLVFYTGCGPAQSSDVDLVSGKWHHAALVMSAATDSKLYVDGVLASAFTDTTGGQSIGLNNPVLGMGWAGGVRTRPLDGALHDVRIYDRELSDAEIKELATPPGAGGVTDPLTWQRADDGTASGSSWGDYSGQDHTATQGTAANQPTFTANGINFNPAFQFDGTNDFMGITGLNYNASSAGEDIFVAALPSDVSGDRNMIGFGTAGDTTDVIEFRYSNGRTEYGAGGPWKAIINSSVSTGHAQIANAHRFSDASAPAKILLDGTEVASGNVDTYITMQQLDIGARRYAAGDSQLFNGRIAEVVYYDRELTPAERQRVSSYLAVKYGITLGHDYLDSTGATIWDKTANAPYNNDIASIGRDDGSVLNQKQSKSVNDDSLVTIGHGSVAATNQDNTNNFGADKTFLTWGNDNGSTADRVMISGTTLERMERIWRSDAINSPGSVQVQVPTSEAGSNDTLLISDSPTFDGTSQVVPMSVDGANYEATTTALSSGTHYFTFAENVGSDLEFVSKTATDISGTAITNYTPGQPLEYHLTVQNNGPADTAGTITVTDTLPTGVIPTQATGDGWNCPTPSGQTVTCTRTEIANGDTAPEIVIEASIASSVTGQKANNASASVTNDPDTSNNSASVTLDAAPEADLSISKTHTGTPTAGNQLTYEFTVNNDGPSDVSTFTVTDNFDSNLTYRSSSVEVNCTGTNNVTCDAASPLSAGSSRNFSITVDVDSGFGGGDITNTVTVAPPSGTTDSNSANDSADDDTSVNVSTDLSISKSHTGNFTAGENNTFTINVTNGGASDAPSGSITVTDTLDEDFAYVSAAGPDWSCNHNNGTVTCTYGAALTNGSTTSDITLTVAVDPIVKGGTTNTATVSGTTPDPDPSNNSSTDNIIIDAEADLALTKSAGDSYRPGRQGQFVFGVTNRGPSADTPSYTITDTLPAGLTYAGYSGAADCSQSSGQNVICTGGAFGASEPAQVTTITVDVDITASGSVDNTATVAPHPSVTDPLQANNSDTVTVNFAPNADLSIDKASPGTMTAGQNEDYTINVTNNGPSDVGSFYVNDDLDPTFSYVSSSPDICTASGQAVSCTGGALNNQDSTQITITVAVASNAPAGLNISNTAEVDAPTSPTYINDPTPGNNRDTTSDTIVEKADLAITKTHTGDFKPADTGNFTLEVTNNGPSDADAYTITDVLPENLSYVDATGEANCQHADKTVTCTGGILASGGTNTVSVTVAVDGDATIGSTIENTASVSSPITDPTPANNSDTDTVTVTAASADLTATKTAQGALTAGDPVTYRFEVTNDGGPDTAGDVTIQDNLPSSLTYQSFSSVSGGTWDCSGSSGQNVDCTLNSLGVSDTAVVDVTVLVDQNAPSPVANSAAVTFNGTDPTPSNPSTSNPVNYSADLEVQLTHESKTYHSGDSVTYTYTVINHGSSAAKDVALTDSLPEGLTFDSMVASAEPDNSAFVKLSNFFMPTASAAPNTPFDCSQSGGDIECTAGTLPAGTHTLTMTAQIAANFTGELKSMLQITSSTPDPNTANNSSSDTLANVTPAPGGPGGGLVGTGQATLIWILLAASTLAATLFVVKKKSFSRVISKG